MIVNIRGTNGSGKSHVVRGFMALADKVRPFYGLLGVRFPEAYTCSFDDLTVYVLGPYHAPTGGCDNFGNDALLLQAFDRYVAKGHVLLEGCRISDHWGKFGQKLDEHQADVVMAFLPTTLEECLARVESRRREAGNDVAFDPTKTKSRWRDVERWRERLQTRFRTVCLSRDHAANEILEIFRGTH